MKLLKPPKSDTADLAVASITNADNGILRSFLKGFEHIGARSINLYLDRPWSVIDRRILIGLKVCVNIFDVRDILSQDPEIDDFYKLQAACYNHAYASTEEKWLAICDTDEFIFHLKLPMKAFLDRVPDDAFFLRASSLEVLWRDGETHRFDRFSGNLARRGLRKRDFIDVSDQYFGPVKSYMNRRGLYSHASGKYIVRAGIKDIMLRVHGVHPKPLNEEKIVNRNLILLHYDTISYSHFRKKFIGDRAVTAGVPRGRARIQNRTSLFRDALHAHKAGDAKKFFSKLYTLDEDQQRALDGLGALYRIDDGWRRRLAGRWMSLPRRWLRSR